MAQKPPPPAGKTGTAPAKEVPRPYSFMQDDFPYIRKASIALAACLAISVALAGGSTYLLARQKNIQRQNQGLNNQANEKYTQAENQKREVRDFQPKYVQLVARGFVGEEKRLDWIESIKKIQETRKLLPIEYEIFPQQPFQVDASLQTGELELRGSRMQLSIQLLHEMDLLHFLQDLKTMQTYALNDCTIKLPVAPQNEALSARLTAECSLYWITLGQHNANGTDSTKPAGQ